MNLNRETGWYNFEYIYRYNKHCGTLTERQF